jgi:hypothetical protein
VAREGRSRAAHSSTKPSRPAKIRQTDQVIDELHAQPRIQIKKLGEVVSTHAPGFNGLVQSHGLGRSAARR